MIYLGDHLHATAIETSVSYLVERSSRAPALPRICSRLIEEPRESLNAHADPTLRS